MKIKTTAYLTLTTILLLANFVVRTPIYPADITLNPIANSQLSHDSNILMRSSAWSEEEYQRLKGLSQEELNGALSERRWKSDLQLDILTSIENRGKNTYRKLFEKLPNRVQFYLPEPTSEWTITLN